MTKPSMAVTIFRACELKVWRSDQDTVILSADQYGVVDAITLLGLTPPQIATLVEAFGRWNVERTDVKA